MAFVKRVDDRNLRTVSKKIYTSEGYFEVGTEVRIIGDNFRGVSITDGHGNTAHDVPASSLESRPAEYER